MIVPDVAASARFYMGVFNTRLHAQPFQGGFRYFVLFGDLPANREVGYLAIGDSRGRGTYIGHFCTSIFNYRRDSAAISSALVDAVAKAGLGKIEIGSGFGGIFKDPDGIEIQFLPAPDTLVTAAVPSDLVEPNKGLVTPKGVDHVLLHVTISRRARSSIASSTARKRAARRVPSASGSRSATRGWDSSRRSPVRSRTSRTSGSRSPRSTATPSSLACASSAPKSSRRRMNRMSSGSATGTATRWS